MKYLVLDCETTGLGDDDKVVEVAWTEIDVEDGIGFVPDTEFYSLVNPEIPMSPIASGINGLRNKDLVGSPKIEDIKFPEGEVTLIGHNVKFDHKFVKNYINIVDTFCTYLSARRVITDCPDFKLQTLSAHLNLPRQSAHRALGDVRTTVTLLDIIQERSGKNFYELAAWMKEPVAYDRMPFGKHKGLPLSEVPSSYLGWLIKQPDLDADMMFTLRRYFGGK